MNLNAKLGILGGGQLGRMLIQSAIDFNIDISILDPDENAPCKNLTAAFKQGSLTDFNTVYEFGKQCDIITIEIENVNTEALQKLQEEGKEIFPQPQVISLIQDKRKQKQFYLDNKIPTADFVLTEDRAAVKQLAHKLPAVHKLGTEGYDGRGVQILRDANDLDKAFDKPGLLEQLVDFEKEIAIIVARNKSGEVKTFPAVELMFHPEHNLVEYLFSPATLAENIEQEAQDIARKVISSMNMIGLLAVEMFVTKEGKVLVNEIAPRPHNSGHQSIEGNITSQFEQHLRAIYDMPLGATDIVVPTAMVNLLGEDGFSGPAQYEGLEDVLKIPGTHIHFYGKKLTKPFRKMGHVTIAHEDRELLKHRAKLVKDTLKIIS